MRAGCLVAATGAILALMLGSAPPAGAADAAGVARAVARPWPDLQRPDGSFRDEVIERAPGPRRDPYGNAMLGYALLAHGLREGDERSTTSALRAIGYALSHPDSGHRAIFEELPLAAAYNLARARLGDDPRFTSLRASWEERLRRIRVVGIGGRRPYFNWYLVEAIGILELLRTGIAPGGDPRSVLAQPERSAQVAEDLINRELPAVVRRYSRDDLRAGPLTIVSDPPHNPPAYHAFSLGLLTRGLELLGSRASSASRDLLERAVRASWALAAPDGALAYFGRSQEQSWALAMTAYGAETAARLPGVTAEQAGRYAAVSDRVLARLRDLHLDDRGLSITPALRRDLANGIRGLDGYVSASAYSGVTLAGLDWARGAMGTAAPAPSHLGADLRGAFLLSRGTSAFAAVRTDRTWFAVKQGPAERARSGPGYRTDMRYEGGLLVLKVLRGDGSWFDALPVRPRSVRATDGLGPTLVEGRQRGLLEGTRLRVAHGRAVTVSGGFRTLSGRWLRRGVSVTFRPVSCGARITVPVRRDDRVEYSVFFRRRPRVARGRVSDRDQDVRFNRRARVSIEGGYSSGSEPRLVRARMRYARSGGRPLAITVCGRGIGS